MEEQIRKEYVTQTSATTPGAATAAAAVGALLLLPEVLTILGGKKRWDAFIE